MKVAVIGAGASGLTAVKCCLDEGLQPVCYERTEDIGGLWRYTETVEDKACVMKTTVINTSKEMMCYSDFPMPDNFPNYCHNTKVQQYFREYVKHFNLDKCIKFKHQIDSISKGDDFENTGCWKLMVHDLDTDDVTEEIFDAVMICTGHHAKPRIPNFPGQDNFKGRIVHTHDYKSHTGYEDQNVVVMGIGNSGVDVAVELSKIAKQVYLSTRRGSWVMNRVADNGLPGDMLLNRRIVSIVGRLVGWSMKNWSVENGLNSRFEHRAYGLQPAHRFFEAHPTVNDELPNRIICGSVLIKPNIQNFTENGVVFEGGQAVQADAVILATGYQFGFPFLDSEVLQVKDNQVNLYKYAFVPDLHPSTLAIIGCVQPVGAIMPIAEMQCRWATRVFKGLSPLPKSSEMWRDIQKKREAMYSRYVTSPRHTIQVDYIEFMDELADLIGCRPNLLTLWLMSPSLAYQCVFGPCSPYQYRLQGPGQWSGATKAIRTQWDRIYKGFNEKAVPPMNSYIKLYMIFTVLTAVVIYIFLV